MTREQAKGLLPIIQAYSEGKTIQFRTTCGWTDIEDNDCQERIERFLFDRQFRIKPEEEPCKETESCSQYEPSVCDKDSTGCPNKEKHYRPFIDTAELMLHYCKHFHVEYPPFYEPLIWVKHKMSDSRYLITSYDELCVNVEDIWLDMKDLFKKYVFLDNSMCGVLIDE